LQPSGYVPSRYDRIHNQADELRSGLGRNQIAPDCTITRRSWDWRRDAVRTTPGGAGRREE
jgi:hypothetical protein